MRAILLSLLVVSACYADSHDWSDEVVSSRALFLAEASEKLDPECRLLGSFSVPEAHALADGDETTWSTVSNAAFGLGANHIVVPEGTLTNPSRAGTATFQAYKCPR